MTILVRSLNETHRLSASLSFCMFLLSAVQICTRTGGHTGAAGSSHKKMQSLSVFACSSCLQRTRAALHGWWLTLVGCWPWRSTRVLLFCCHLTYPALLSSKSILPHHPQTPSPQLQCSLFSAVSSAWDPRLPPRPFLRRLRRALRLALVPPLPPSLSCRGHRLGEYPAHCSPGAA